MAHDYDPYDDPEFWTPEQVQEWIALVDRFRGTGVNVDKHSGSGNMEEGERKNPDVAREYRTEQIVVYWEPAFCIHTARCLQGLPRVFDSGGGHGSTLRARRRDRAGGRTLPHRRIVIRPARRRRRRATSRGDRGQPVAQRPALSAGPREGGRRHRGHGPGVDPRGAVPMRRLRQQAVLRRHAPRERVPGALARALQITEVQQ